MKCNTVISCIFFIKFNVIVKILKRLNEICHNDFSFNLKDKTKHGIVINIFYLCVIGHRKGLSFYKKLKLIKIYEKIIHWLAKIKIGFGSTFTCREGVSTPTTPVKSVPLNQMLLLKIGSKWF